jgi:hypothetical protein
VSEKYWTLSSALAYVQQENKERRIIQMIMAEKLEFFFGKH